MERIFQGLVYFAGFFILMEPNLGPRGAKATVFSRDLGSHGTKTTGTKATVFSKIWVLMQSNYCVLPGKTTVFSRHFGHLGTKPTVFSRDFGHLKQH